MTWADSRNPVLVDGISLLIGLAFYSEPLLPSIVPSQPPLRASPRWRIPEIIPDSFTSLGYVLVQTLPILRLTPS